MRQSSNKARGALLFGKGAMRAVVFSFLLSSGAEARIRCEGPSQIVNGEKIDTPYCEDAYLAQVARSYGSHVSADAIRNSPSTKQSICRFIGQDLRVRSICAGWTNYPNR